MKWESYISHSLKITELILLSANICNWETEKLFDWDYLRKPIFSYLVCYEILFSSSLFFKYSKPYTKLLQTFSSIQSNNKVSFNFRFLFSYKNRIFLKLQITTCVLRKNRIFLKLEITTCVLHNVFMKCQKYYDEAEAEAWNFTKKDK